MTYLREESYEVIQTNELIGILKTERYKQRKRSRQTNITRLDLPGLENGYIKLYLTIKLFYFNPGLRNHTKTFALKILSISGEMVTRRVG